MKKKTAGSKKPKRSENLRSEAERLLQDSPERSEPLSAKDLKSLVHELQVHQIELEMQNEELRNTRSELEESRNRYFDLYDLAPVGYFNFGKNGIILETNLTGARLLGTERSRLQGRPFSRFVLNDDQRIFFSHLSGLLKNDTPQTCELHLRTKDAATIYTRMESMPVSNGTKEVIHIRSAVINVTEQKQAESALRESEERFRLMAETSADIIFQIDPKGLILYSSPSAEKIFGYTPAEVKATPFEKYVSPSDVPVARKNLQKLIFGEKISPFEVKVLTKRGNHVSIEVNAVPLIKDREVRFIFGIARDITDRKRAEEELEKERFHLAKAQEIGRIGTWDLDVKANKLVWTNEAYRMFGIPPGTALTYESFLECVHPQDRAHVDSQWHAALKKEPYEIEHRIIVDDKIKWVSEQAELEFDENGNVIRAIGAAQDITDRKRMEEELRESRDQLEMRVQERTEALTKTNEALKAEMEKRKHYEEALKGSTQKILQEASRRRYLSGRLVETLEKDRRDVAMDLHDQIGQMLATLKMDLEMAEQSGGGSEGTSKEKLRSAEDKVVNIMSYVREISRQLRPDILDTLGLIPALRSLIDRFKEAKRFRIHFYYREPHQKIAPDKSLSIYRITQEALNNVAKHARAKEVFVNLILKNNKIQLSVEDDGIGFNYDEIFKNPTGEGSLGMMIMRERAVLAGGELSIESKRGKGTHIVAEIPID
jgi:PAS domain S-box-containing protein